MLHFGIKKRIARGRCVPLPEYTARFRLQTRERISGLALRSASPQSMRTNLGGDFQTPTRDEKSLGEELGDGPVLVAAVGEEPAHDERDLVRRELLHRDLERVRLALEWHEYGSVHAGEVALVSWSASCMSCSKRLCRCAAHRIRSSNAFPISPPSVSSTTGFNPKTP